MRAGPVIVCAITSVATAQDCSLERLGTIGGEPTSVVIIEDHAYVAARWGGLHIYDIGVPHAPVLQGVFEANSRIEDVDVRDGIAYLASSAWGLVIADVSGPAPSLVSWFPIEGVTSAVDMMGHYAVLGTFDGLTDTGTISVIDVSTPAHPDLVGTLTLEARITDIEIADATAFISARGAFGGDTSEFAVVDLSSPADPALVTSVAVADDAQGIAVEGDEAFIVSDAGLLTVYDVSDWAQPVLVSETAVAQLVRGVDIAGTIALLSGNKGLAWFDITDPSRPTQLGLLESTGDGRGVHVDGGVAVMADGDAGIAVVDMDDLVITSRYDVPNDVEHVVVIDDLIVVLDDGGDLHLIDMSEPVRPAVVSTTLLGASGDALAAGADVVFSSGHDDFGTAILDITDRAAPMLVGAYPVFAHALQLVGDILYLADDDDVVMLDVSDPALPVFLGEADGPVDMNDLAVQDGLAYLGGRYDNLRIVDVSNPASPQTLGEISLTGESLSVDVEGDLVAIARDVYGVAFIDVSDPSEPVVLSELPLPGDSNSVVMEGGLAFVSAKGAGVRVVDVANPHEPSLVGTENTPGVSWHATVAGSRLYVADLTACRVYETAACMPCEVDVNGDGTLNVLDFVAFQLLWVDGDRRADCDGNGAFDVLDFVCFEAMFGMGCP